MADAWVRPYESAPNGKGELPTGQTRNRPVFSRGVFVCRRAHHPLERQTALSTTEHLGIDAAGDRIPRPRHGELGEEDNVGFRAVGSGFRMKNRAPVRRPPEARPLRRKTPHRFFSLPPGLPALFASKGEGLKVERMCSSATRASPGWVSRREAGASPVRPLSPGLMKRGRRLLALRRRECALKAQA